DANYKVALAELEGAARSADPSSIAQSNASGQALQKIKNVRREALTDSVQPFTEVRKPEEAVAFYGELSDTRNLYRAILEKLGNRYFVQQNWEPSARIYRTLITLTHDDTKSFEFGRRFYECVRHGAEAADKAHKPAAVLFVAEDAAALTETAERYSAD